MTQVELFELSDGNNPLVVNGNVIARIDDMLDLITDDNTRDAVKAAFAALQAEVDYWQAAAESIEADTAREVRDAEDARDDAESSLHDLQEKVDAICEKLGDLQEDLENIPKGTYTVREAQKALQDIIDDNKRWY